MGIDTCCNFCEYTYMDKFKEIVKKIRLHLDFLMNLYIITMWLK